MIELLLMAIALAMDSVAVSIASGSKYKNIVFKDSFKIAIFFGFFQGFMPFIGYFLGITFSEYVKNIDHWVAFILLNFIGAKMLYEAYKDEFEEEVKDLSNKTLLTLSIATSIDALAVGITFAFLDTNIYFASSLIAIVTTLLCVIAVYIGKYLGSLLETRAEILGGVILILLGFKILLEHLKVI